MCRQRLLHGTGVYSSRRPCTLRKVLQFNLTNGVMQWNNALSAAPDGRRDRLRVQPSQHSTCHFHRPLHGHA